MEFLNQDFGGMHVDTANGIMFQSSGLDLISAPENKISQLHILERSAYTAVLRAFCAQSNALSWGKEGLITELRTELRVSDVEHREILALVSSDKSIKQLRGQRKQSESQVGHEADHKNYDAIPVGPRMKNLTGEHRSALAPISVYKSSPAEAQVASKAAPNVLKSKMDHKVRHTGGTLSALPCTNGHTAVVAPAFKQIRYAALAPAPAPVPVPAPALASAPVPVPTPAPVTILRSSKSLNKQPLSKKKRISDAIHIRPTDMLIQQIKEACSNGNSDPVVVEKAKEVLRDQEKVLMEAICIIDEVTDSEEPPKKGRKKGHSASRRQNTSSSCIEKW